MRFLKSEAGAIVLWLVASLFVAALLTPYLYDAGKTLGHSAEVKDYPGFIESIAGSARRADPDRFFSRALLISALALMPALVRRVKSIQPDDDAGRFALRKLTWAQRLAHLSSGILIGSACLGFLAMVLHFTGAAAPNEAEISAGKLFTKALLPALGAGVIEELVFRGLLLGIWLRACSVWTAWIGSSLMFSFVHFLKPPPTLEIADPRAWHAGFEILGGMLSNFSAPLFFIANFTVLALLGLTLAWVRTRTFSLWMPIGIHAGLVFALKTFSLTSDLSYQPPWYPWFVGADLKSGVFPLVALVVCFAICFKVVRLLPGNRDETIGPRDP